MTHFQSKQLDYDRSKDRASELKHKEVHWLYNCTAAQKIKSNSLTILLIIYFENENIAFLHLLRHGYPIRCHLKIIKLQP